jgi:putative oxidoreductase
MASSTFSASGSRATYTGRAGTSTFSEVLVLAGRILFSFIFIMGGMNLFSRQTIGFAAAQGVPLANLAVPLAGVIAILGGLSVALGYHARLGAWLIVLFLVPVTLMMHKFWGIADPAVAQMQMVNFMKNVSMLGGALIISQVGAGPFSLDSRAGR